MTTTITNRELLRNYKDLKARLLRGQLKEIRIKQDEGVTLTLKVERTSKKQTAFEHWMEEIQKHPIKGLKRPEEDLFDERK